MTQLVTGMAAATGRALQGVDHLRQSIADILGTPVGSRLMRRDYGSQLLDLIDWPNNPATRVRLHAAIASALIRWEPRLRLSRVTVGSGTRAGQVVIELDGVYTPDGSSASTSLLGLRVPLQLGAAA